MERIEKNVAAGTTCVSYAIRCDLGSCPTDSMVRKES